MTVNSNVHVPSVVEAERGETRRFDIAILGSRPAGLILGAILARHGLRTVIIDSEIHPRYQCGEDTIPFSSLIFEMIADRYDVPQIRNIARARDVRDTVMPSSGIKKNLGFLYHSEGKTQDPSQALQFNVPSEHGESHLYRQDVDAYLLHAAVEHGVVYLQRKSNGSIEFGETDVRLQNSYGDWIEAEFVIDAAGEDSPIAQMLGLRTDAQRFVTHTTRFATHMIGVAPYDDTFPRRFPEKWHNGTLHHVFDGGWIGVMPFNNVSYSTNSTTSVVIHLQGEHGGRDGDQVLADLAARFPSLREHLGLARRVREWEVASPAQYGCIKPLGSRYLLLDESAYGNDLLFSRKLSNTAELVFALGHRLIAAARKRDYQGSELTGFAELQQGVVDFGDRIIAAAYVAMSDPALWNAFARSWLLFSITSTISCKHPYDNFVRSGDVAAFAPLDMASADGIWMPLDTSYRTLFTRVLKACETVRTGGQSTEAATKEIFVALAQSRALLPPIFDFGDPNVQVYNLTMARKIKTLIWGLTTARGGVGKLIFYRNFKKKANRPAPTPAK